MRFYPKDFSSLLVKIKKNTVNALLLYGPDKGMVAHFIDEIKNTLSLPLRKIEYSSIDSSQLPTIINSMNLFADKELIVFSGFTASIVKETKQLLESSMVNFAVFVADEMPSNSSSRLFFEKNSSLAVVACYSDFSSDLKIIARNYLTARGKNIQIDALSYLCSVINNDRRFLYSELEKICLYCHDQETINLQLVQELIISSKSQFSDKLCYSFARRDADVYFSELDNLIDNNNPAVLVIRSLIRYYINMYFVKQKVSAGYSVADAMKKLTPPIIFSHVEDFKGACQQLNSKQILYTLKTFIIAEKLLKLDSKNNKNVLENIFYQ